MINQPYQVVDPGRDNNQKKAKKIRCRQCGKGSTSSLIICPHCGRELHPAPSRVVMWGLPIALIALFVVALSGWAERSPVAWLQTVFDDGIQFVQDTGSSLEPGVTVVPLMTPIMTSLTSQSDNLSNQLEGASSAVEPSAQGETQRVAIDSSNTQVGTIQSDSGQSEVVPVDTETPTPSWTPSPTTQIISTSSPTNSPIATEQTEKAPLAEKVSDTALSSLEQEPSDTPTVTDTPIQIITSTNTPLPTNTALLINTLLPTDTSVPTDTPIPTEVPLSVNEPLLRYEIRTGDTLRKIGSRYNVSTLDIMNANNMDANDARLIRPGQIIIVPVPARVALAQQTYTIQAGDTPYAIAQQFGISVESLLTVNGLTSEDARKLRTGQQLIIPTDNVGANQDAASTTATATPAPIRVAVPTNTPTPGIGYRLNAPLLRAPETGASISCASQNSLVWEAVLFINADDQYVLHLGFVSAYKDNGDEIITWVLAQAREPNRTSWEMDNDYCALAPQELQRQWRWYVEVVDSQGTPVSLPSEVWGFGWN